MTVNDMVQMKPAKEILSALLDRYEAPDLIGALGQVVRTHRKVRNQNVLADDLQRLEEEHS